MTSAIPVQWSALPTELSSQLAAGFGLTNHDILLNIYIFPRPIIVNCLAAFLLQSPLYEVEPNFHFGPRQGIGNQSCKSRDKQQEKWLSVTGP